MRIVKEADWEAVSAFMFALTCFLSFGLLGSVDTLMEKAQTPDFLQMHAGEIYVTVCYRQKYGLKAGGRSNIMSERLIVKNLCKDGILKNINFVINDGEMAAVMGHSGSGKSTLLYQVSGMDRARLRLSQMGFVFQQMNMLRADRSTEPGRCHHSYGDS